MPGGTVLSDTGSPRCPFAASIRQHLIMDHESERHGVYVARWRNEQTETGFDSRLVLKQRQAGEL